MLKTWSAIVVVLIAALSVLSDATPVTATDRHHDKYVTVDNKVGNPVPVVVGNGKTNAIPVFVTNMPATLGGGTSTGGGTAAPEEGAQFKKVNAPGTAYVMFTAPELQRTLKRFVVDFVAADVGLTLNDCSLLQVRVDDANQQEVARAILTLHGNTSGLWGGNQAVKLFVDPGSRILVIPFPGCDASSFNVAVVGHYISQ